MTDHSHDDGFRGMRRVGQRDDQVTFRCDECGATYDAPRCSAVTRRQTRCGIPAARGDDRCPKHGGVRR